jgi:8-oxo-dGTP pyrophosphatase MutT (NUDIX family)
MEIKKDKYQNNHLYPKFKISPDKFKDLIDKFTKKAIFIHLHKQLLPFYFSLLDTFQFNFYKFENDIYTYYLWIDKSITDKVPPYTTSSEGVGALIFSPDQLEILLVEEWGHWKFVSGNVDSGENIIDTLKREIKEEVGLEIEKDIQLIGGWQINKSSGNINDNFHCFKVVATSFEFKIDGVEIKKAKWFSIDYLLQEISVLDDREANPTYASLVFGEYKVSLMALIWLRSFKKTGGLNVFSDSKYTIY